MNGYPIQLGKVQRPPLRVETLARHRLLDWLDVKIHHRVVFVIADAGYGKTTLLADFSRRTRLRTLWYRMDQEDRGWPSFLLYLVAAGRQYDPNFAPRTSAMLEDTGPGGPSRDDALESFLRELPSLAQDGAILILDDFHVADDVADINLIARALVTRAPERLTLVFSSRRMPSLPVARLRALGEVGELRTEDLRFSGDETEALFKETYGRPLEPDVLVSLRARTEGWAASLYLVQAALRDRSARETRAFVRNLSGAQDDLYDYLAEEVVGDLPAEFQRFLMRTSILQAVSPEAAEVVTGLDRPTVTRLIAESERRGLLARSQEGRRVGHSFHPLVRQFLESRFVRDIGDAEVREIHRRVAHWAETRDWRASCFHYAAAGDGVEVHRILNASIETILGVGEVALAGEYLTRFPPTRPTAGSEIIRSRVAADVLDVRAIVAHAQSAVDLEPSDAALLNLLSAYFIGGDIPRASMLARGLAESAESVILRQVGEACWQTLQVSLEGTFGPAIAALSRLTEESHRQGYTHYEGVSLLNCALILRAQGSAVEALRFASEAVDAMSRRSPDDHLLSAHLAQAWATAHLGQLGKAREILSTARDRSGPSSNPEWLMEASEIELWYGDASIAAALLAESESLEATPSVVATTTLARAQLAIRRGDTDGAERLLPTRPPSVPNQEPGHLSRFLALRSHLSLLNGSPDAGRLLMDARAFATRQGAGLWAGYCDALLAVTTGDIARTPRAMARCEPVFLSMVAEAIAERMEILSEEAFLIVSSEAEARPERWRASARALATDRHNPSSEKAARLLDTIGVQSDVSFLRTVARQTKATRTTALLGRGLARRLAPAVIVEDQGRVEIRVGAMAIAGSDLRRKVLAMLCFLLTRPSFSATRDEVVDALWPDMAPDVAVNSLNQTVYFLRRVFEPGYKEDVSAGYVRHDSDMLWLERDLIRSRSQECRGLIDAMGSDPSPQDIERLSERYLGRFALDFAYEDWAGPYRESLHVGYLQAVERAVTRDMETGHYDRGIRIARRALDIDPDVESLELSLLRLYRITGAHSAAAEQYAHYAAYMRTELGVEPPPLASL